MAKKERRRAPRVFHSLAAKLEREDGDQETVSTIDLSSSGALLDVKRPGQVGEVVVVTFETSPQTFSEAAAVIRRSLPAFGGRRHIIGVSFLEAQPTLYATACARESLLEKAWDRSLTA